MIRDPLLPRFLDLAGRVTERQVEQAMVDTLTETLLALRSGFVGRQVHLNVDGEDFYLDLHVAQLRYVVVEPKVGRFAPAEVGQLSLYVEVFDAERRRPEHRPTVGLLLCTRRDGQTVRNALRGTSSALRLLGPVERLVRLDARCPARRHSQGGATSHLARPCKERQRDTQGLVTAHLQLGEIHLVTVARSSRSHRAHSWAWSA